MRKFRLSLIGGGGAFSMIRVLIGPRGGSLVLTGFCVEVSCIREVVLGALHFCLVVSLMYSTLGQHVWGVECLGDKR